MKKPGATPVLSVHHAQKRFGAIEALKDVSLEAFKGEVLALLGDNGAGKSTLVKCISGLHALDGGQILIDGERAALGSPAAAQRAGIETVYQDLALFENPYACAEFLLRPRNRLSELASAGAAFSRPASHGP